MIVNNHNRMNIGVKQAPKGRGQNSGVYKVPDREGIDYQVVPGGFYREEICGKKRKYSYGHPSCGNKPFCSA
jgi:hypothetical protein